jgi:hypothetical protein
VGGFPKSATEQISAEISEYRGKCYAHLRILVRSAAVDGAWIRTAKGVALPIERLPELLEAVNLLREVAGERTVARLVTGKDELRIGIKYFRTNQYLDVRTYYKAGEEWRPTSKGVTAGVAHLSEFVELVKALAVVAAKSNAAAS